MSLLHLLEPEETVGNLWHRLVGDASSAPHFPKAAVAFIDVEPRLRVFFHGLGGGQGVVIKPAVAEASYHRRNWRARLGRDSDRIGSARFDGERFILPDVISFFPERDLNEQLYFWLAAWTAVGDGTQSPAKAGGFAADLARVRFCSETADEVVRQFPGLRQSYAALARAALIVRATVNLPPAEAAVEAVIRTHLANAANGSPCAPVDLPMLLASPPDYKTYLPVPLWGEIEPAALRERTERDDDDPISGAKSPDGDGRTRKAARRKSDRIEKKGGLIVHRFEKILSWAEFMNLHRDVDDDDENNARKAADDHDEIGVTKIKRRAATRLKFDLDLAPGDVDAERLSAEFVYPEWDYRKGIYQPQHARVLERIAEEAPPGTGWQPGPETVRRIRAVRRQFEALRPKREVIGRQLDGHELDMDAVIRSRAEQIARGQGSDQLYRQVREQSRDLSVAILVDISRSTESAVDERTVIDIEKEALIAIAEGLAACGDPCAIYAFSSLRRNRVFVPKVKDFDEAVSSQVRARIGGLRPGFYTRLGAAVRHVSAALSKRPTRKRLLLVLTDGKPNDLDHYDGRYGIEDSRKAINEARQLGHAVFGITIDRQAQSYFPRIFGARAFSIVGHPSRLTSTLPVLYRHLIE